MAHAQSRSSSPHTTKTINLFQHSWMPFSLTLRGNTEGNISRPALQNGGTKRSADVDVIRNVPRRGSTVRRRFCMQAVSNQTLYTCVTSMRKSLGVRIIAANSATFINVHVQQCVILSLLSVQLSEAVCSLHLSQMWTQVLQSLLLQIRGQCY